MGPTVLAHFPDQQCLYLLCLDFLVHPWDAYTSTSTALLTCTARLTAHGGVYYREELPRTLVNGSENRGDGVVRDVREKIEEEDWI